MNMLLNHLSIIVIIGAALAAAEVALIASTPSLKPRFWVFHFLGIVTAFSAFADTRAVEPASRAEIGGFTPGNSLAISRSLKTQDENV
jgi:hypothetical protein